MAPRSTRRLFGHYAAKSVAANEAGAFVALRLAEEGDREDLRWLLESAGEEALREILARYGGRQLSRRSQAFWRRILDLPLTVDRPGREIWPR